MLACHVQSIHHDEQAAARIAVDFVRRVVIDDDREKASLLMTPAMRSNAVAIFAMLRGHGSNSQVRDVSAVEYEPVPGEAAMQVFLIGREDKSIDSYYRVLLEGTRETGYLVAEVERRANLFPPGRLRFPLR